MTFSAAGEQQRRQRSRVPSPAIGSQCSRPSRAASGRRTPATARRRAAASACAACPPGAAVVPPPPCQPAYVPDTLGYDGSRPARRSRRDVEKARRRSRLDRPERKAKMATSSTDVPIGPSTPAQENPSAHLTADDRVGLLRAMLLMRAIEERAMNLYRQGKVPGSFYDGFGQEAVSVGATWAMAAADRLCVLHRDLGAHLVRGVQPCDDPQPVHGPRGRHHERPRRQRPLRRLPHRLRRHGLDAARHDARRGRHGDGLQAARRAALRADVVRRRLDVARRLPRGDELGRRPAPAGDLRPGEQPVRLLDADQAAVRGQPRRARRRLRLPGRVRRRQRRRGDVRGHARRARARDLRRRPDADRGRDDAHARPRRARRHEVRAQGARRGVAPEGPDRSPERAPEAARRRRRRARQGGPRRGRRGGEEGARRADARPRHRDRPPLSSARRRRDPARGRRRALERLRVPGR